jgi:hypothetical protein
MKHKLYSGHESIDLEPVEYLIETIHNPTSACSFFAAGLPL